MTCVHTNVCHCGCVPHTVTVLKLKNRGIPSLISVVFIADHSHAYTFCLGILRDHPRKSPLKFYYVKYIGIKSDDTAFWGEHVII